jgi:hypothetical protein
MPNREGRTANQIPCLFNRVRQSTPLYCSLTYNFDQCRAQSNAEQQGGDRGQAVVSTSNNKLSTRTTKCIAIKGDKKLVVSNSNDESSQQRSKQHDGQSPTYPPLVLHYLVVLQVGGGCIVGRIILHESNGYRTCDRS